MKKEQKKLNQLTKTLDELTMKPTLKEQDHDTEEWIANTTILLLKRRDKHNRVFKKKYKLKPKKVKK
ncbi:unnamed protein product [Cunninghamella blakesleeana]